MNKKLISLLASSVIVLLMIGCSNKEEKDIDELNKTIDELMASNDEKDKEIAELKEQVNDKKYEYDSLQQLYMDLEVGMKLDDANDLITKYDDIDTNVRKDPRDYIVVTVGFSRYMKEMNDIKYVENGDSITIRAEEDSVGQLKIYYIDYHNYAKDMWCENEDYHKDYRVYYDDEYGYSQCERMDNTEEQINYIIDK